MAQELTQVQAIDVLIQAARLAQAKGAFTLEDAALVSAAIKVFVPVAANEAPETASESLAEAATAPVEPVLEKVQP